MPTVRCPTCRRALHLPENREVATAQCPLCQTTFAAPSSVPVHTFPAGPTALPDPIDTPLPAPPRRSRQTPEPAPEPSPFDFEDSASPEERGARRSVQSAVWWLKAGATIGLAHLMTCGCVENVDAGMQRSGLSAAQWLWWLWIGRLIGLLIIYSAAESLSRRRSQTHATLGGTCAVLVGGYLLFRSIPGLFVLAMLVLPINVPIHTNDALFRALVGLFAALVGAVNLVAGIKTFLVLGHPVVRQLFAR